MEVLNPSKKHTSALEMVSEEEEEEALESEHEEGEISSEEEEDAMEGELVSRTSVFQPSNYSNNSLTSYASHFSSFPEHRPSKKLSLTPVASEVVIYDDSGRTAIFTSPKKPRVSSYPRRGQASRQHARELPRRKEEGNRSRRHHISSSSSSQTAPEKWPKASRRSAVESKGSRLPQEGHTRPYKVKVKEVSEVRGDHRPHHSRPPSPDNSSQSSSCSSCSSSSSSSSIGCSLTEEENDVSSVSLSKGRENRRCGLTSKGHDRSLSLEYGCEPPPSMGSNKSAPQPPAHRPKHGGSQHGSSQYRPPTPHPRGPRRCPPSHHNSRRGPKDSIVGKVTHHQHQQHHRVHQKPPKAKPSERKDASKLEKSGKEAESVASIAKGQSWLPRGSLGEMLLSRSKVSSTHLTPSLQNIPRPPGEDPKAPVSPIKAKKLEEEEKVVEEVVEEPPTSSEVRENSTLDQEDDEELQLRLIAIQSSLRLLTDMQRERQTQEEEEGEGSLTSTPIKKTDREDEAQQDMLKDLPLPRESRTPPVKDAGGHRSYASSSRVGQEASEAEPTALGDVAAIQISDDIISISSSSASEICVENLATNTSYLEADADKVGGGKAVEDSKRKGKERLDVDQDPVDMEICNSSGEEEGGQAVVVQDSPLSPEPGQDAGTATMGEGGARLGESVSGVSGSNFQIPVEWAYMMPPPPPPDQPANDLHNINSWCFDQNMYLQAMQVAPADEQQQQGQAQAGPGNKWPAEAATAQPHTSPWPDPFQETYDNNTLPQDANTPLSLPMGLPPDQQQQQHEYAYSEIALPQDASPPGHSNDLKDTPAEQYQAFMSAVLQQQQPSPKGRAAASAAFAECSQRNLIMVPLSGSHQPGAAATTKVSKKAKAKKVRTKRRPRKKQALQECGSSRGGDGQRQVTNGISEAAGAAAVVEEEDDEDVLRAQLLIDMSRKKEQRLLGAVTTTTTTSTTTSTTTASASNTLRTPFPASVSRATAMAKEGQEGRASPQTLLQPSEALLASRSLRVLKGHSGRPRSGESSPTHSFRGETWQGLSDIGGWGLDPKGSKFNYHSTQHDLPHGSSSSGTDAPKVKFPAIQPVIICLQSDSDDSASEGEGGENLEVKDPASEPISQSIDNFLKSIRNANVAATSKEPGPASPKPGPSTSSVPPAAPSSPATRPREVADSTPQAVRHLSRPQQEEYRRLKEQLRKKEMLQRKKMQQRPARAKPQPKPHPPTPSLPPPTLPPASPDIAQSSNQGSCASPVQVDPSSLSLSSGSEASSSTRAVTWKDVGLLQIQVHNDAALDVSSESTDSGCKVKEAQDDSSANASTVEDEDEETLRMMALLTQKKKKAESSTETQQRRVIMEERIPESAVHAEAKDSEDVSMKSRSKEHSDEGMKGEWMVLDEVREEGIEAGEEELCARLPGSSGDEVECGEGTDTSDDAESVTRSPGRGVGEENQSGKQQVPRMADEEPTKKQTNKTNENEASDFDGEAGPNTATTTASGPSSEAPDKPASEGGSVSQPDTDTKQQDPPLKPDVRQTVEPSCNEKIEEVIRRIESKTRGVREKVSRESSPAEVNRTDVASQLPNGSETTTKLTQGTELRQASKTPLVSQSEDTNSTLVKPSHSTTTNTTTTTTPSASLAGTVSRGAAGGQNQSKVAGSKQNEGRGVHQHAGITLDTIQKLVRKIKMVRPASSMETAGKETTSAAPAATVATTTTTTTVAAAGGTQGTEKSSKVQLQLKKLEKEYKEKKNGINGMLVQLGQLLKEVNEEQQQRQELKNGISELQSRLREMKSQLENKSNAVQIKMELIRHIQIRLGSERQALSRVEHQGERLGQQVYGAGYNFSRSLPLSPRSKVKDMSTKKNLASSIYALHQQVQDLTTKRKNTIKASPANTTTNTMEAGVAKKQNATDNNIKTSTTNINNTTEAGVVGKQGAVGNARNTTTNTTEAGVVRTQNSVDNTIKTTTSNTITITTTTEAGVVRMQNAADDTAEIPTSNNTTTTTLDAGVLRMQNAADNTIRTPVNNTTNNTTQGPESRVLRPLNSDAKKETPAAVEKVTFLSSVKSTAVSHSQGVPRVACQSRSPTNTQVKIQGKEGTLPPQGKPVPVKRKAIGAGLGAAKVARVQAPTEGQLSAIPEKESAKLASRPRRATTNGVEREKLDEMKALCPHDLLGRCNDTSCQYQHLPSVQTSSQVQTSLSNSQQPQLVSRVDALGNEPLATTTNTSSSTTNTTSTSQGKVMGRARTTQVKVVSGAAVPNDCSSEEVKSQLLSDIYVSEQRQQTQTVTEKVIGSTALLETATTLKLDTQATTQTDTPTTEKQTDTPNNTTDSKLQVLTDTGTPTDQLIRAPNTTDTQAYTTQHQAETPTPTDLVTLNTTHPEAHIPHHHTHTEAPTDTDMEITDKQTERHKSLAWNNLDSSEASIKETAVTETAVNIVIDTDIEMQTLTASTEPKETECQETQTETEGSVKRLQTNEAATLEAQNAAATESQTQTGIIQEQDETVVELQTETEGSAAHPEIQTCTIEPPQNETEEITPQRAPESTETQTDGDSATAQTETVEPQTAPENTEAQAGADKTEHGAKTKVTRKLSDTFDITPEMEGKEWSPSDLESLASTSSTDNHLSKCQSSKASSRPAKRRTSSRRSMERVTEDSVPDQDLQSEGETVTELQEETRVTRKSLRVKAKTSPKGIQSPKSSAKSSSGKGQKRKSEGKESPSKHPSGKKRYPTRPQP